MTAHHLGWEISCDGPTENRECPDSNAVPFQFTSTTQAQVRADGRALGWTRPLRGGHRRDLCPDCKKG
ncbi:hypothetical protein ACFY1V_31605 [Streptomyces sp. NPDC001255]|uniref:hypothetical protein n=1 Tax=Streptomyces sp. NPDC001255 TaxID=3364550 RepID=UPI00368E4B07